ncbi:O-antigen/teichoic acid export membrane protein [Altererythrobacter atlanticus]|uniref:Inner membrane protein YghQ n=1 Tax=Croceibacterium atlanticum TaxID=1267766 RepID=A0A0F7KQM2_9SPHN|nr:oligosaccharide flippase family protein [Croceibacterium atlanticum]AKH42833.1 Inner membrane protein YghQ [Croceibacterium atlanticum]MBB5731613.1 O-antigen/teichoic acid export membrane protein [Croceibacterium atlanticum]
MGHFRNIGHLLSGNAISNVMALVSLAIVGRALETELFGIFVLVITYVRLVERFVRFESWQPLIRFASNLEGGDRAKLPRLYLYGILLDLAAAFTAAFGAVAAAAALGSLFGLDAEYLHLVAIYSVCVLFNLSGWTTAALRMAGRFKQIAYSQPIGQVVRIPLALFCWYYWPTVTGFMIAWAIAQLTTSTIIMALGWKALREEGISSPLKETPRNLPRDFPGFIGFAWSTNLSMTLRTMTQEADVLLVGALAGPSSAGFYHVAKRLAKVAQQVGAHTQAVLYPQMARFWSEGKYKKLRRLTHNVQLILSGLGVLAIIAAALVGQDLVELAMGQDYGQVGPLLVAQLFAVTLIMHAAPSRSILLSMGRPGVVLRSSLVATILFFICALLLIPRYGAMGANLSHIAFAATTALWMDIAWLRLIRQRIGGVTQAGD